MRLAFPHSFLVNDPESAPFGASWLRGITPARLGVLAAVCFFVAFQGIPRLWIASADYYAALWHLWDRFGRGFACAIPMFVLVIKTESWTARASPAARIAALVLAVIAGAALYTALRGGVRFLHGNVVDWDGLWESLVAYFVRSLLTGGLLTAILYLAVRERDAERLLHRTKMSRAEIERQLAESRLKLLHAQIEPHFLFNSLASVKRLYEGDKGKGRALLENLAAYLRAAALTSRQREIPLCQEVALARSFLGIFEVRMGGRLRVRIDVPAEHGNALIPPMTLGTLVENAIKHGLAPRAAGGSLDLRAYREGGILVVDVGDDGVGFQAHSGGGVGLANIRARLEALFGAAGSLELAARPGGGVTATLRLPYRLALPA